MVYNGRGWQPSLTEYPCPPKRVAGDPRAPCQLPQFQNDIHPHNHQEAAGLSPGGSSVEAGGDSGCMAEYEWEPATMTGTQLLT